MSYTLIIIFIAVFIPAVWLVSAYNGLVRRRYNAKEALSDIDVQLKRRFDLIPNLVETVKGYLKHEKEVLENITKARASVSTGGENPLERAKAEDALSNTLKTLFAVSENYPDLKANANFLDLQRELSDTENKIQASRRFYNVNVMELNTMIKTFPTNTIAGWLGFKEEKFFEVKEAAEKEPVKVKF
jgi:LemA protein